MEAGRKMLMLQVVQKLMRFVDTTIQSANMLIIFDRLYERTRFIKTGITFVLRTDLQIL